MCADLEPLFETLKVAMGTGPCSVLVSDRVWSTISTFDLPGARARSTNAAIPTAPTRQVMITIARLRVSFTPNRMFGLKSAVNA
jgi:hypothetical protein